MDGRPQMQKIVAFLSQYRCPTRPRPRTSGSQIIGRFGRLSTTQSAVLERGRGILPNGRCLTGVGGSKKSLYPRTSLMDDP